MNSLKLSCTSPINDRRATQQWVFREPEITDGDDVYTLISNCPPLDINSSYCNFLQVSHFSRTCLVATHNGKVGGFISAYRKPQEPNVLFIWQAAVAAECRGEGLALTMLETLLSRESLLDIQTIETTITEENHASWSLFKKLDAKWGGRGRVTTFLDCHKHFKGKHDTEYLYRIPKTL